MFRASQDLLSISPYIDDDDDDDNDDDDDDDNDNDDDELSVW